MAYLGRKGAEAPLTSGDIPDGSISAVKVAADVATQAEIDLKANLASPTLTTPNLGTPSAVTLTNATFPAGHVVQTVNATLTGLTTDTSAGTSIDASHITKDIQITAGNSVKFTFNFINRIGALSDSDYVACKFYVYHKVDGGSFANVYTGDYIGTYYHDHSGNLPAWYGYDQNYLLTGIHTPSSDTHHHYTLYYKFETGNYIELGISAGTTTQNVILEEIQV